MHDRRHFVDWTRPALHCAVELLAARYAVADELDLRRCTLVVPGARGGRRLKELLVEEATKRGLRLLPPHVTTLGHLPELLYEPPTVLAEPALCRRAWSRALRLAPDRAAELFRLTPAAGDLRGWLGLARQLATLHEVVAGAGLRFGEVADRCGTAQLYDDGARWMALAEVQHAYVGELQRANRSDRDLTRIDATQQGAVSCDGTIFLIGIADMPVLVQRMLLVLPASQVNAIVHAPQPLQHAFDELGCVRPDYWAVVGVPVLDEQLRVVERPADQAVEALDAIAALRGGFAADDIVVGVPDEEVVPYIEERLGAAGVPARYAGGTPVELSAPFRLLAAIADVLDGDAADAWAALARHPDLWRWLRAHAGAIDAPGAPALRQRDAWLTPLDVFIADELPSRLGRDGGSRPRPAVAALLQAVRGPALLGPLRGRRALAEWMPQLMELLLQVYGAEPLNRDVPLQRRLLVACTKIRDAAAALHRVPDGSDDTCDAAAAVRILLDEARGAMVPAEPDRAAVELLGWLELHLDDAPVAVITGVNEPFLPASQNADAFLPDSLRAALGLEDNARRYARDAYQLTALLHSRSHTRLVAGRRSAAGDPLRPSRLLLAAFGKPLARRVQAFYGDAGHGPAAGTAADAPAGPVTPVGEQPTNLIAEQGVSGFVLPPEPVLRGDSVINRLPVTAFRSLLNDPYAFALERVLGLRQVDDRARELDPLQFGGIAHEVLERFGRSADVHLPDAPLLALRLDALLEQTAVERYGRRPLPAVRLQVEQLRARLHAFADWHAAWVAAGWRVVGIECQTPEHGVPFDVDGEPVLLTGRIDRIDYHDASGRWAVFDYKTGEHGDTPEIAHRKGRGEMKTWIDLQLPLYRHILPHVVSAADERVFSGTLADVDMGFITLSAADSVAHHFAEWDEDALAAADDVARECVRLLRANTFEFSTPTHRDGDFAALVGVGRLSLTDEADDE
jgi:ATP-dependent helicase/nuclease subunit B